MDEDKKVVESSKKDDKKGVDVQAWKMRKLDAINQMTNQAKARALAERVSRGG